MMIKLPREQKLIEFPTPEARNSRVLRVPLRSEAAQTSEESHRGRKWLFLLSAVLLCQFLLVAFTFPLSELGTAKPLIDIDAAWHLYHVKLGVNLAKTGNLVGYDPFFNAGYPGGITYNWSAKFPVALTVLLDNWLSDVVVYKLYAFFSKILAPLCIALAIYWLGLGTRVALIGSVAGFMLWWASIFRWFDTAGMISFVFGSFLALAYTARMIRYLEKGGGWACLAGLGLVGAITLLYHPLFPVPVAFGMLVYFAFNRQALAKRGTWLLLLVVPLLSLLPNLYWLYLMNYYHRIFPAGVADFSPYQKTVDIQLIWKELIGPWIGASQGAKVYLPLMVAAIWACVSSRTAHEKRLSRTLTIAGVFLLLLAAIGASSESVEKLQPNRFFPVGYLFLCIPASLGCLALWKEISVKARSVSRVAAVLSLMLISLTSAYAGYEVTREISHADIGHYGVRPPEVKGLGDRSQWILNWLEKQTTDAGRILFETSKARVHDGGHFAGYYAYTSKREFIGGPYPFHHFAGFWDGELFGRSIEEFSDPDFRQHLDLYNIGWIIVHSEVSKKVLGKIPGVELIDEFRELKAYQVNRTLDYFVTGRGRVMSRDHNQLLLGDLEGEEVILKYHYIRGLKSEPPAEIVPFVIGDDPNPFIRILHPPNELVLSLP